MTWPASDPCCGMSAQKERVNDEDGTRAMAEITQKMEGVASMVHPDKSHEAAEFVRILSARLIEEKGYHPFAAVAAGLREWKKSPFRAELMRKYNGGGFNLDDDARERRASTDGKNTLKASLFEMAGRKR